MNPFYAGIGSRETPPPILKQMESIGATLASNGFILRSGGAEGADSAFERGCDSVKGKKQIFIPWTGFQNRVNGIVGCDPKAESMAAKFHPAWNRLSQGAKKLMARNSCQMFGATMDSPTGFVVCWTKDGGATGGTGQALRIAEAYGIPIFNLFDPKAELRMLLHLGIVTP